MHTYQVSLAQLAQKQEFLSIYKDLKALLRRNGVEVSVDVEKGLLSINGSPEKAVKVPEVIKLLLNGVSLQRAERYLLNDEYHVEIDLKDTLKPSDMARTLSRIIGSRGSFKRRIEEITGAEVVVREGKILIVGSYSAIEPARLAIEEIILGKPQSVVIRNLERRVVRDPWRN